MELLSIDRVPANTRFESGHDTNAGSRSISVTSIAPPPHDAA